MANIERILIVGGGIAGLTLATALHRQGFRAELVERSSAWHAIGAGILLHANGLCVLRALGMGKAVEQAGAVVRSWGFFDQQGEILCDTDLEAMWGEVGLTWEGFSGKRPARRRRTEGTRKGLHGEGFQERGQRDAGERKAPARGPASTPSHPCLYNNHRQGSVERQGWSGGGGDPLQMSFSPNVPPSHTRVGERGKVSRMARRFASINGRGSVI